MFTMMTLETGLTEEELFLKLVSRGRHADIEYYFSVDRYDWEEGVVVFTRLDCAPAPSFKVGVAGNKLVVSATYWSEVSDWLRAWGIVFAQVRQDDVNSPEEARRLLAKLRANDPTIVRDRGAIGIRVQVKIVEASRAADDELLRR